MERRHQLGWVAVSRDMTVVSCRCVCGWWEWVAFVNRFVGD